jgi:hypothetical protein
MLGSVMPASIVQCKPAALLRWMPAAGGCCGVLLTQADRGRISCCTVVIVIVSRGYQREAHGDVGGCLG